jgi:RNA polymerase sigma factor (sigma-70 family)
MDDSSAEAEELAQETFVRLIDRFKRGEVSYGKALLSHIATNLTNDRIAQHNARQAATALMPKETEDHRTPEMSRREEHTRTTIQRSVAELPQRSQHVIARLGEGGSYEQIARELGVRAHMPARC